MRWLGRQQFDNDRNRKTHAYVRGQHTIPVCGDASSSKHPYGLSCFICREHIARTFGCDPKSEFCLPLKHLGSCNGGCHLHSYNL